MSVFKQWLKQTFCRHRVKFEDVQHWPDYTYAATCYKCDKYLISDIFEPFDAVVDEPVDPALKDAMRKHYDELEGL
jgi:hypothetical protein